jgi:hypothetical protein
MLFTVDSAKQFLLTKLRDQAQRDGVALDDIEQRMFLFSESSGTPDFEANEKFEVGYDATVYETKVMKLLHKVYKSDKSERDQEQLWTEALKALRNEDFYGLVMVDQAAIPRGVNDSRADVGFWSSVMGLIPFAVTGVALLGACWFVVFEPIGVFTRLPDWVRLPLLPAFVVLFWYAGKVFGQVKVSREAQSSMSRNSNKS